ncbi:hypothetical protein COC69_11710 [Bacillus cereus]|uniref:Radical SAM core domain-containing protein n=1 Tax=Bacillus cereus TaxID=1396 RepID=A0A9X7CP18_BACCE|nr:radical SAM protein [Bacillus cereus]PGS79632.1 hypothetical protein COC69_11710 [Bacillus cereus]
MSVELRPLGVSCNISCTYCYQTQQREAGNIQKTYDMEKMKKAIEKEGGPFVLFGGEPLLLPFDDLEEILRWGLEKYGRNQIQTNGVLINDEHIRLFHKYKVDVGISIDGPDELNDLRWQFNLKRTRENTQKTINNIRRLCEQQKAPGLIITLHRLNASVERLPRLLKWVQQLDELGVPSIRLHLLEVESELIRQRYSLSDEENIECLLKFSDLQEELKQLKLDVLDEMNNMLLGKDRTTSCVWHACDSYTTQAVRGIEGNGHSSNCGRTNKDGVDFIKANKTGFERYIALYHTPQEHGGCKGCRFFLMCKGQCPGTALNGDWRNRSELCKVWKELFSHLEERLIQQGKKPLSLQPIRHYIEEKLLVHWEKGIQTTVERILMSKSLNDPVSSENHSSRELRMPSFVRHAFVGEKQRLRWEPRILAIRGALAKVGVLTVANQLASVSMVRVPTHGLFELHQYAAQLGFHSKVISRGQEDLFERVIVGRVNDLQRFDIAMKENNWKMIHKLLGIPSCCSSEMQIHSDQGNFNSVMDLATPLGNSLQQQSDIHCSDILNILLRPVGIDLLGYFPCSFQCKKSEQLGKEKLFLGREAALDQEMDWLEQMLGWPAEWTSLHGIAELKTGILKISNSSFSKHDKITLRYHGQKKPLDAAYGLTFIYNKNKKENKSKRAN